ncbi:hypothetical protein JQ580_23705 [Bradyrhizobium japonicum]|uniref:hypothetical protein n=1 Tax=Bradyrhizobium japonicum TaxID=375 RepID=UPI001BAC673C|nr:hypothetical protein [Bradyrhizobium japonicum]MBR0993734.1 hypothetical protein [Bradyrhizobium japonicum]
MNIAKLFRAAIVGATLMVMPAQAATYLIESFSFAGSGYSVAGKFVYDPSTGQLQSISGNVISGGVTQAITGLIPADYSLGQNRFYPDPTDSVRFMSYDNLFIAGAFSQDGVLFSFAGNYGGLYLLPDTYPDFVPGPYFTTWLPDGPKTPIDPDGKLTCPGNLYCAGVPGTFDFTAVGAVPELSSWTMMLLGFLGVGILGRAARRPNRTFTASR